MSKKSLTAKQQTDLIKTLKARFEKNKSRHKGQEWEKIQKYLESKSDKLLPLYAMEETGGEPDVFSIDKKTGEITFYDFSPETPAGRRSLCYDREGWKSRKEHRPENTAEDLAVDMGIELLNETEYFELQKLGKFDTKTSSWIETPAETRKLGGALYGEFRYNRVFIGANGAQSYYGVRGFRGKWKI